VQCPAEQEVAARLAEPVPGLTVEGQRQFRVTGHLHRLAEAHQPNTKDTPASPTGTPHQHQLPTNRTDEVQYEANGFARDACGGVLITSMPSPVNTASKTAVNLLSRSRSRNRIRAARWSTTASSNTGFDRCADYEPTAQLK
jgi:hypothetical protein